MSSEKRTLFVTLESLLESSLKSFSEELSEEFCSLDASDVSLIENVGMLIPFTFLNPYSDDGEDRNSFPPVSTHAFTLPLRRRFLLCLLAFVIISE
jgi:hypothetical protein